MSLFLLTGLSLQFDLRSDGWWYSAVYRGASIVGEHCASSGGCWADVAVFVQRIDASCL